MLRAHLIMNPQARGVTTAVKHVVAAALEARLKLEITETHARDAGIAVAREAVSSGAELIVAFGGDGLVNEAVNGMAGSDAALAIIAGGTMNVLARTLGLPTSPLEAVDRILMRAGEPPGAALALGSANGRRFTFACGCGFDAESAERVESHPRAKQVAGEAYFYAAAFRTFLARHLMRPPQLEIRTQGAAMPASVAIALTGGPYAYLAGRPVRLCPRRPAPGTLNLFVVPRLRARHLPAYLTGALRGRFGPAARCVNDAPSVTVASSAPFAWHVDGEAMPASGSVTIEATTETVRVVV